MKEELERKVFEKYPDLYATKDESGKPTDKPCVGFSHGDGWYDIIDGLSSTIRHITKYHPERKKLSPQEFEEKYGLRVVQVKEKFGGLRYYVDNSSPEIEAAIMMAESMSFRTCEFCGNRGSCRSDAWIRTLCDECDEKTRPRKSDG